jgi:hypothetical protein
MQNCFVEGGPLASPDGPAVVERVDQPAESLPTGGHLRVTGIATNICCETTARKPPSATSGCSSSATAPPPWT